MEGRSLGPLSGDQTCAQNTEGRGKRENKSERRQ